MSIMLLVCKPVAIYDMKPPSGCKLHLVSGRTNQVNNVGIHVYKNKIMGPNNKHGSELKVVLMN